MYVKKAYCCIIASVLSVTLAGQAVEFTFVKDEARLKEAFSELYKSENDKTTDSLNQVIHDVFSAALQIPESFNYRWTSLNMIGQQHSSDGKLNVYSWYVKNVKGNYSYYGFMQFNAGTLKKPDIKFYVLSDKTKGMQHPETLKLTPDNWLGCVYFNINDFTYKRRTFYTLLGYNFNNDFSDKKYIEVLVFDKEGNPAFEGDFQLEFQKVKRIILEYSAQLVASVSFDKNLDMIVCDHLAPFEPMFTDNYRFYGPDGSYDGYKFSKGRFTLKRDVDARNKKK